MHLQKKTKGVLDLVDIVKTTTLVPTQVSNQTTILVPSQVSTHSYSSSETKCLYFDINVLPCPRRNPPFSWLAAWWHFPRYESFVRGIHRSPVNSLHKGQWRGALMFLFYYLHLNKRLSKQSRHRWFETLLHSLGHHCNGVQPITKIMLQVLKFVYPNI